MFGYCCIECNKCDAYVATRNDDDELRAKVAKQWKMKAEEIIYLVTREERLSRQAMAKSSG